MAFVIRSTLAIRGQTIPTNDREETGTRNQREKIDRPNCDERNSLPDRQSNQSKVSIDIAESVAHGNEQDIVNDGKREDAEPVVL